MMGFPGRRPPSRNDMGEISIAVAKDIGFLENFGRFSTLLPINRNWTLENGRKLPFDLGLALISVCLIFFTSFWDYDSLDISKLKRNSAKIHSGIFYLSLWISSSIGRLALLIVVPQAVKFFRDLRAHVTTYCPKDAPVRRGFKVTCLFILNLIYAILLIQYIVQAWKAIGTNGACNRLVFPCDNTIPVFLLSIVVKFMTSVFLYYVLFFVIVISDLLTHLIIYFKTKIFLQLDSNSDPTCSFIDVTTTETGQKKPFKLNPTKRSLPVFLSDLDSEELSYGMFKNSKMTKTEMHKYEFVGDEKIALDNREMAMNDLHEEFSQLKKLFNQFNSTLGPSMGVAFLADTLIIICIIYTACLKIGIETGQIQLEDANSGSLNVSLNGWDNETMQPLVNEESQDKSSQEVWKMFFAALHESRSILLAFIGSHLRNQITLLKDKLERKVEGSNDPDRAGSPNSKSVAVSVARRVQKWTWEFRFLDMMTVSLSLIPAMIGTVMTYVVVLLQIRLSEGP